MKLNRTEDEESIRYYYNGLKKCPPITKREETKLFKKFKNNNDFDARNKIITSNLRFVFQEAKKFVGYGVPLPDLISEGNYGLIKAVDKYDPKTDNALLSYAIWWIRQSIHDKIKRERMLVSSKVIIERKDKTSNSFDEENHTEIGDDWNEIQEPVVDEELNGIFKINGESVGLTIFDEHKEMVTKILNKLSEREKKIIIYSFGLDGSDPMNLDEMSEELGISKERVRQIKEKTMKKMRSIVLVNNIDYNN